MKRPAVNRDKEARMRALAGDRDVRVERAARSGCFRLIGADGQRIADIDGTVALPVEQAIKVLEGLPIPLD